LGQCGCGQGWRGEVEGGEEALVGDGVKLSGEEAVEEKEVSALRVGGGECSWEGAGVP
jgi:hypothetical protein